jgi:hypothetical protein
VAKGNLRRARGVAASDSLPLFPPDVSDKPGSRRNERAAAPNVVAMPRKTDPTPEDLARKAMAHQPTGASGKKLKLTLTIFLSREQAERLTAPRDPREEESRSAGDGDLGGREGMNPGTLLGGPDYVTAWIRVDRLIHRVVGHRLNQGSTPALDAQFDRLIILHRWLEKRLGN